MRAGLLGRRLGYSYSPRIHACLGTYDYELFEIEPDDLDAFLRSDAYDALNVTIPYKRAVIPYCAALSPAARAIGSVNTIVRRADGTLWGDNTDAAGFGAMLRALDARPAGEKALVLGSGGASLTVQYVLRALGAREVVVISRGGADNYENLDRHADAALLVNATPVGTAPDISACPLALERLPALKWVLDLVYNPARTRLLQCAADRGIAALGGLTMLIEQARAAAQRFTGLEIPEARTRELRRQICAERENLVLIGMPGCGKTTLGRLLAARLDRPFADCDAEIEAETGLRIADYLRANGEAAFRALEARTLTRLGARGAQVIATGGGCVKTPENRLALGCNGRLIFVRRALDALPTEGRPLSQAGALEDMYRERLPLYERFADATIDNDGLPEEAAEQILEAFYETAGR